MSKDIEKRLLQVAIVAACFVPVYAGMSGIVAGTAMLGLDGAVSHDSHYRYLSGLLFAIGLGFLSAVPKIEKHSARFTLLSCIVVIGGLARLFSVFLNGWPDAPMIFALGMELFVVPVLWLWHRRVCARTA